MDIISQWRAVEPCFDFLWRQKIEVRIVKDYDEVSGLVSAIGKEYLTPMNSPMHNDMTLGNTTWLVAEVGGEPVMMGAARFYDLVDEDVTTFWPRQMKRAYGETGFKDVSATLARALGNRIVYFGDLFSCGRASMKPRNIRAFTAIGHISSFQAWSPDSIYAFVREKDVMRGADRRYGFTDIEPLPFVWKCPKEPRSASEWCAYLPKHKLDSMTKRVVAAISEE